MDEDFQNLEAELKRLRPVEPPRRLVARIAGKLETAREETPARRSARGWWVVFAPVGITAVIIVALTIRQEESPGVVMKAEPVVESELLKPVALEKVLVGARDEGLVTLDDGTPARRARLQYVDTITWKNPRTNASLTWTVPREEVRVVPVRFQ